MSTIFRNELGRDIPSELINEIISWILEEDTTLLHSVSLVSKAWRAVALRYLFSTASFVCKNDFVRWGLIGASLPHVAQYVRHVVVDLGATWRRARVESVPTGFIALSDSFEHRFSLDRDLDDSVDYTFPRDSEFDVIIPLMRNATELIWTTPSIEEGFDPTAANVTRLLQSFPNITYSSCVSNHFLPGVQEHIMTFFHNIRDCRFTSWRRLEESGRVYDFPRGQASNIDVSQLEEIWCKDCEAGSMDWLVDNVLPHSPSRIRKIFWEYGDFPFSPDQFVRLLLMVHETLEDLCFRPPWDMNDSVEYDVPPFDKYTVLPVLQKLAIRVLQISEETFQIMQWLDSILAVFPPCPCLQRVEIAFHLTDYEDLDAMLGSHHLDWNSLLVRYPSVKVLEFEMVIDDEDDFDDAERERVETLVRQETEMVNCDKFVIRWS